jgi:hypothetical protein
LQEKLLLGRVVFREDVVMVIEKIEGLRKLELVLGNKGRLLRRHGGIDLCVERGREESHFPRRVSVGAGEYSIAPPESACFTEGKSRLSWYCSVSFTLPANMTVSFRNANSQYGPSAPIFQVESRGSSPAEWGC